MKLLESVDDGADGLMWSEGKVSYRGYVQPLHEHKLPVKLGMPRFWKRSLQNLHPHSSQMVEKGSASFVRVISDVSSGSSWQVFESS